MNARRVFGFALLVFGFASLLGVSAQGPDGKGSVLRSPFDDPAPRPAPPSQPLPEQSPPDAAPARSTANTPDYLRSIFPDVVPVDPAAPGARRGFEYEAIPDINKDIELTPAAGNWLIMVISYPGKDGAAQARKFCLELRAKHRVPAYVFVFGAEERRKEYERVKKIFDQQQAFFKQNNMTPDQPIRLRHQQIDVHHAVLMGGYPDDEAAKRALTTVKEWPQPDEKKVDLEVKSYTRGEGAKAEAVRFYVNPYKRSFVCRNPTVKHEAAEPVKLDVAALRRFNADEPYSLFNCKKTYTLAVKEFQTPNVMHDRETNGSIWNSLGGFGKTERPDTTKISAHNLADTLRKIKLDAYVLHAKFSSSVTVGSYDSVDDPALKAMQETLAVRFNQQPFSQIQFFHRPVPMAVPR